MLAEEEQKRARATMNDTRQRLCLLLECLLCSSKSFVCLW
jgi:hypothetical protein